MIVHPDDLFHIHTYRCGHADNTPDEAYIKRAVKNNAKAIWFTDHAPYPGDFFGGRMKYEQLPEYVLSLRKLKEKYKGIIDVKIGLEVEYLPKFSDYYKRLQNMNLDVLLLGQHICELPDGKYSFELSDQSEFNKYMCESILDGIDTGIFQVVAHPDRIFRYMSGWDSDCEMMSKKIISAGKINGTILEKNFASLNTEGYYRTEFWNLVPDDTSIIYGIDAHKVSDIDAFCKRI